MQSAGQRVLDLERRLPRLVLERGHGDGAEGESAHRAEEAESGLGDAPAAGDGATLVHGHQDDAEAVDEGVPHQDEGLHAAELSTN